MNELNNHNDGRRTKRRFSIEEKRDYCFAFEKSELKQLEFCKKQGISCSALKRWIKGLKQETNHFTPVIVKEQQASKQEERIPVEVRLPNQLQLCMAVQEHQLFFLIQELSYATSIIR